MDKKFVNSMFESLLHIGNKTNYWNPKMKEYIYGSVNGIHVINLIKTGEKLEEVKAELKALATEGKKILFVATKLQLRDPFVELAKETGHYYVSEKWVPGLLTNFKTIKKRINTYLQLLKDSESGALDVLTKKEKAAKLLELEKLDKAFKGLKEMKKPADVLFVVDSIYESQSVREGNSLGLDIFAVANTNGDDTVVKNIIPANTNSLKSAEFVAAEMKSVLAGIKVKAAVKPVTGKAPIKRMEKVEVKPAAKKAAPKKEEAVTEKKAPAKKAPAKKAEAKTEEK